MKNLILSFTLISVAHPFLAQASKLEYLSYKGLYYQCTVSRGVPQSEKEDGYRWTSCNSSAPTVFNSYEEYCTWTGPLGTPKCQQYYYVYSLTE